MKETINKITIHLIISGLLTILVNQFGGQAIPFDRLF
jgi:hypothetical protein